MAILKLYDYTKTIQDDWWGDYEQHFVIGQGELSAGVVVPLIESVSEGEDIIVKINSVGGFVFDGWAIYNALKAHKGKVIVRIEGLAASIASIIAMAGEEVVICQAAMLMIHKPTVCPWFYESMDSDDLKKEAAALDQIQAVLNSIYVAKTGLESDVIDSMINSETYITPQEAVSLGFANRVENTITERPVMAENVFKHVFKNKDAKTRAYANSIININKSKNMADSKETIAAVKENTKATNGLIAFFNKIVGAKNEDEESEQPQNATATKEDGTVLYYEGELAVDTAIFLDEAMTESAPDGEHLLDDGRTIVISEGVVSEIKEEVIEDSTEEVLNARIAELEAENASLTESLNSANSSLKQANEVLTKFKNTKSNFKPKTPDQKFERPNQSNGAEKLDLSKEAREARKAELANLKNKK